MFELLGAGLLDVIHFKYLLPLFVGTLAGVVGGALPGVTITMTIILVLPFTYGLDPLQGLAAMSGVYVGGSAGGLITACLIGIPGTPSAIATTFDGFPMARKGEPGRAVWLGTWASFWGGILGGIFLIGATAPLAAFALQFGPWEYFSLFIFALSMVAGLTEASLLKGLLSGAIGLVVTVIGADPIMAVPRLTMGSEFLQGGFQFLPILIGIFAFAQIMADVEKMGPGGGEIQAVSAPSLAVSHLKIIWEILSRPFLLLWSTWVGILIGVLPAIGGSAAHIIAHPIMVLIIAAGARFFLRIVSVPKAVLIPVVLVLCVIGAYALNNIMENVYVLLIFGFVGYVLVKFGFPLAPLILGVILGDQIEVNLVRAIMTDPDPWLFVTRPISGTLIALSVASVTLALWQHHRAQARMVSPPEQEVEF